MLLLLLLLLLLVVVVVVVAPAAFSVSQYPKIGGVSRFLKTLGAKNTLNAWVFCAPESQHHGIYDDFWLEVEKFTVFIVFFWLVTSKNIGIYAVFSMLQEVLLPCQRHKHAIHYSVLALGTHPKRAKVRQTVPKMTSKRAKFYRLFFPPQTPINLKA